MKLYIKNMVCQRCVLAVESILQNEPILFQKVLIGEILLQDELSGTQKQQLQKQLSKIGFELINNYSNAVIEKIKQLIIKRARNESDEQENKLKLSRYISTHVNHEYTYLSSLFSSIEGRTIEKYFIEQRIEKTKELLIYGQMTLSQIAFDLEYSSVSHLSNQFKKVTGLTPSYFKELGSPFRKSLDKI